MNKLHVTINENGYSVIDAVSQTCLIEGIQSWCTACELHEMFLGELQYA